MYLICYGTRPELIKLAPVIKMFSDYNAEFKTLFTGQHKTLIKEFQDLVPTPDYIFTEVMETGQSLERLTSKILIKTGDLLRNSCFTHVVVQGDTTTAFAVALSAFYNKVKIVHIEAGIRTYNRVSPFPEEINRRTLSCIADTHICPTESAVKNLRKERITENVFLTGNTVVDMFEYVTSRFDCNSTIKQIVSEGEFFLVTLHRRENRGEKMQSMWKQLNTLSEKYRFVYITHPSIPESIDVLNNKITVLRPQSYQNAVHLILNCSGVVTDSGGLQEESVCAGKRVLICRDTTERPETVECGLGRLIDTKITENIDHLLSVDKKIKKNPFGESVCKKIALALKL